MDASAVQARCSDNKNVENTAWSTTTSTYRCVAVCLQRCACPLPLALTIFCGDLTFPLRMVYGYGRWHTTHKKTQLWNVCSVFTAVLSSGLWRAKMFSFTFIAFQYRGNDATRVETCMLENEHGSTKEKTCLLFYIRFEFFAWQMILPGDFYNRKISHLGEIAHFYICTLGWIEV